MFEKRFTLVILFFILLATTGLYLSHHIRAGNSIAPDRRLGMPIPKDDLHIAILFLDGVAESSYSRAHDQAITITQKDLGLQDSQIIRKSLITDSDEMLIDKTIRDCVEQGANIIIATSFGYMNACEKLSRQYPNVVFAHAFGDKYNNTNFTNYCGRLYQAMFVGGVVAGLKNRTGKIGFVAAMGTGSSEVTRSVNAFALGVESVNPEANVLVHVTHSWYDPRGEREAAKRLLDEGCDVVAQYSDTASPMIEAEKAGAWGIGNNIDMMPDAPKAVLTSVVWNWNVYYTHLAKSVIDGTFTTTPYLGSIANGMVDLAPLNPKLTNTDIARAVDKTRQRIISGELTIFNGGIRTNTGDTIGTPGTALSDEQIFGGMNWYYHTVKEMQ